MASSKSMDFPGAKKSSYAAQVEQSKSSPLADNTLSFLPVPGPVGPQGQSGRDGKDGKQGEQGTQGPAGPRGERGNPGKDGASSLSSSGQQAGWASYTSLNSKSIRLGASHGTDGWVDLVAGKDIKNNEQFLPRGCVSLWNVNSQLLNFKGLQIGSQVFVTYNFELTTFLPNTEVWIRTFFKTEDLSFTQFIGSLKYQNVYDFSITQQIFVEDKDVWASGAIPQMRTDFDASVILNSVYASVV